MRGIAAEAAGLMFGDPFFKTVTGGSDIKRAVGAPQYVKVGTHWCACFETRPLGPLLSMSGIIAGIIRRA